MISAERYGPWAVIAGGSEGVGRCFAQRLARAGINLALLARKPQPLQDAAREVQADTQVQVRTLSLDLAGPDVLARVRGVTDDVEVGLLIYNAGGAVGPKELLEQTADEALLMLRLNAVGQTLLSQHFAKGMVARGRGGILLVGSLAGKAGCFSLATYSAAKAYTQVFGESLWAEMKPHGVDVLVLMLGRTRTPALQRAASSLQGDAAAEPDAMAEQGLANLTNGPVYVPQELVGVSQRLSSMPRHEAIGIMSRSLRPHEEKS